MSNLADFGAAVLGHILDDRDFFGREESEEICEVLRQFGYATRERYDPERHGNIDNAVAGDVVWIFTQSMKDDAAAAEERP